MLPAGLPVLAGLLGLFAAGPPPEPPADPSTSEPPPSIRDRPVTWTALLALAAGTYSLRLAGLVLRDRLRLPARVERYVDLGATALLVALVTVSALLDGDGFAGWARPVGRPGGRLGGVAARAVRPRRAARGGDDGGPACARRAVTQPLGATSYRARLRVKVAAPDVMARRSTA